MYTVKVSLNIFLGVLNYCTKESTFPDLNGKEWEKQPFFMLSGKVPCMTGHQVNKTNKKEIHFFFLFLKKIFSTCMK